MSIIYEPKGAALEYSPLAVNIWTTCSHGCKYCYVPACLHKSKEDFFKEGPARKNIVKEIAKDCQKLRNKGDTRSILLCFLCDPYQPHDEKKAITREVLEILELYKRNVQVLTKGGMRAARDFDILKRNKWKFGTTLHSPIESIRQGWEPGAATVASRVEAIQTAYDMGIFTWVSVEPVIYTADALQVIEENMKYVNFWKVGKLNHEKEWELKTDWKQFLHDVQLLLKGKPHYIKTELLAWGE